MKTKKLIALTSAVLALPAVVCAPGVVTKEQRSRLTGCNFAHRGLHTQDKTVPENSLPAFELAAAAGYGIELDVQLSKDGQVVVFHDDTLTRVCGIDRRVDELNWEELKTLSLCDTDQTIPLFADVLNLVDGRGPLVVEIKPTKNREELCRKTRDLLRAYKGEYCVESFDPFIVTWFRLHAKEILRGQLAQPPKLYTDYPWHEQAILGNCLLNVLARPQFISYKIGKRPLPVRLAEKMGAMKVGWTSHEKESEEGRDAVIFEFYRPDVRYK